MNKSVTLLRNYSEDTTTIFSLNKKSIDNETHFEMPHFYDIYHKSELYS